MTNKKHIGFDEVGMDAETSVKNIAYACPTDISKFPFDTQECILEILPWGVMTTHLTLTSLSDNAHLDWYTPNSDWTLTEYSTSVGIRSGYNLFFFKMRIKREPLYYTVVIILPTLLFAVLRRTFGL
jgi:hypothetical protein